MVLLAFFCLRYFFVAFSIIWRVMNQAIISGYENDWRLKIKIYLQ